MKAIITGVGHYVPSTRVTNQELVTQCPSVRPVWTTEVLGIEARRIATDDTTSTMALKAAQKALVAAGYEDAHLIDLIIVATSTPDRLAPATAAKIHSALHARETAGAFDVNAVCAGFVYALSMATNFIASGAGQRVLVIASDKFSSITNWQDRNCVFFGDGAAAIVVEAASDDTDGIIIQLFTSTDTENAWTVKAGGSEYPANYVTILKQEHYFSMNSRAVYNAATRVLPLAVTSILEDQHMTLNDIKYIVPHQPSKIILEEVARRLNVPVGKVLMNMREYANTVAATIPLMLSEAVADGRIVKGDWLVMPTVGSGWVYGAALLRWAY